VATLPRGGRAVLLLEARSPLDPAGRRQRVEVAVNGVAVGAVDPEVSWNDYRLEIPDGRLRPGPNRIELSFAHTVSPAEVGTGADRRSLALALRRVGLLDPAVAGDVRAEPTAAGGEGIRMVPLAGPGRPLPLVFEAARSDGENPLEPPIWSWHALDSGLSARHVARRVRAGADERAMFAGTLAARQAAGEPGCLRFETGGAAVGANIDRVLVPSRDPQVASLPRREPSPELAATAPDIVIVLLDAARPDHFGCYGYSRDTTPNIDRLARRSLVFRNVFATTPATLTSLPTMITGLSFVDHGLALDTQALSPEATTLAEYLEPLGYDTVGLSANGRNSRDYASEQGYDEFVEMWEGYDEEDDSWIEPGLLTELALARLDRAADAPPLFLLLHYVPPHEPYRPAARFDRFGDPVYHGGYDGELETRVAIDRGELRPSADDLAEIVSLYDGNLLAADHEVGRLLERLERSPRWERTVLLVVSDHGEAFLEHGRMGHNTTVYDEMLRVPFILRLPGDRVPGEVDTTGMATLEDLTPTLLGLAGVRPDSRVGGRDLLAGDGGAQRWFVARSAGTTPDYAIRTGRWKAIFGTRRPSDWRLYDLQADPGETRDVAAEHPERLACMAGWLEQGLEPRAALAPVERPPLDARDLEVLRALGYVE